MKPLLAICTIVLALASTVQAADTNYVVIGAFAVRENAVNLAAKTKGKFEINPAKKLFYVYTTTMADHEKALAEATRLRRETGFKDAWVFLGTLGIGGKGVDVIPASPPVVVEQKKEEPVVATPPPAAEPVNNSAMDPDAKSKDFYFTVIKDDGTEVSTEITVIDGQSNRKQSEVKSNEFITLKALNQSGDIRLECAVAGYRKIIQTINFKNPTSTDGVTIEKNRIVVPFNLVRLQKGDIAVLYNVYFFKDAAIMRPESKVDLDGLLAMMLENPKYKIKIHGHTNGNSSGPIFEVGDSGDLFALAGAREGRGSAKKLSEERATIIRDYLVANAVEESRMAIKAWGGKKPIYEKDHAQASANVRVEVEVIEN